MRQKGRGWVFWDGLDTVQSKIEIDWEEHASSKATHLIEVVVLFFFQRKLSNDVQE